MYARETFFLRDEHFHFQFALPELRVVLRTDSGKLFQGMNDLSWPVSELLKFGCQPRKAQFNQNRKCSGRSSKKTEAQPTSNTVITSLEMEKRLNTNPDNQHKQTYWPPLKTCGKTDLGRRHKQHTAVRRKVNRGSSDLL